MSVDACFYRENPRAWRENIAGDGGGINLTGDGGGKDSGKGGGKGGRETRRCEREREKIWRESGGGKIMGEKCQEISLVINLN
jgi:hypothetical protein